MGEVRPISDPTWKITPEGSEQLAEISVDELLRRTKDKSVPLDDRILALLEARKRGWA